MGFGDAIGFRHGHQRLRLIALDVVQRHGALSAGAAAIQPALQWHLELIGDLLIAEPLRHIAAGFDPQFPQPVADAQRKTRVAQVVQQLAFDLRDEIAGGAMTQRWIKADRALAQALISRAE